jgi:hypothetical protein
MKPFPLKDPLAHIAWEGDRLLVLDQRLLPRRIKYVTCRTAEDVAVAIRSMILRGAPLIGVAAAYGMALAARRGRTALNRAGRLLRRARPTAVNLMHGVDAMLAAAEGVPEDRLRSALKNAAVAFHREDVAGNQRMAVLGASLSRGDRASSLTATPEPWPQRDWARRSGSSDTPTTWERSPMSMPARPGPTSREAVSPFGSSCKPACRLRSSPTTWPRMS